MDLVIKKIGKLPEKKDLALLVTSPKALEEYGLSRDEIKFAEKMLGDKTKIIHINQLERHVFLLCADCENFDKDYLAMEAARKTGNNLLKYINEYKIKTISLIDCEDSPDFTLAVAEGMALGSYKFLKYFSKKNKKEKAGSLKRIEILSKDLKDCQIENLNITSEAVYIARDLVNEPVSYLTAPKFADEIKKLGKEAGFGVKVFGMKKIEKLKMGGLLAVNKGSIDPPRFSILTWKPDMAKNKKPLVLVGKGIVYDTGGLSLKPTPNSMDEMKCDMGGAATVVGTMYAIAKAELPYYVVGLVPSTDNRPDGNAYAPGDVVTMHNGLQVEVLNTDAEGRMILADALSYAQQYKPKLVIDAATLTGAAAVAIGIHGIVAMGNADGNIMKLLKKSGNKVFERIAEFPFWDEYGEEMKSDIADLKNIGGREGGAITAGKFLENFTDYPYIHLDIAGPAFLGRNDAYRLKGGTGVGIRLLFDFIQNYFK